MRRRQSQRFGWRNGLFIGLTVVHHWRGAQRRADCSLAPGAGPVHARTLHHRGVQDGQRARARGKKRAFAAAAAACCCMLLFWRGGTQPQPFAWQLPSPAPWLCAVLGVPATAYCTRPCYAGPGPGRDSRRARRRTWWHSCSSGGAMRHSAASRSASGLHRPRLPRKLRATM